MKYLGKITDPKDLVTKEYTDAKYSASNPPPYPVTSVNGQTGAVNLMIQAEAELAARTAMNRLNNVNVANTSYTAYMARGIALLPATSTSNPTVNGTVAFYYE